MKKKLVAAMATGVLTVCLAGLASAALIPPVSVTPGGAAIIDGYTPPEWTQWQTTTTWWVGTGSQFTIDYGSAFTLADVVVSVDNNDSYRVDYSLDNLSWTTLFNIAWGQGDVGWGMDTFSTVAGDLEYHGVDFAPVSTRYLKIYATGGDNLYSVGELQSYGTAQVPEPSSILLAGAGLTCLAVARRRRRA